MRLTISLAILVAIGCTQQPIYGTHLKLKLLASQQSVLLVVDENGRISYGGGYDALQEKTTWHGEITNHQQLKFDELVASSDWLEKNVIRSNPKYGFEIHIRHGIVDNSFLLPLSDNAARSMFDFLQSIAIARLQPTLNSLPKPSMDTIIDRKSSGSEKE